MNEREAKVWAARLARIWNPQDATSVALNPIFHHARIHVNDHVEVYTSKSRFFLACLNEQRRLITKLFCGISTGEIAVQERVPGVGHLSDCGPISTGWLPFFRRNCWLSGLPIEASTHEKTEWLQGFKSEEIESWNLKF